jgi:uncharacterized protein (TIGR01777 family)
MFRRNFDESIAPFISEQWYKDRMKILITGATGLIGKSLCRALLEKNYDVKALVRNVAHAKSTLPYPMEFEAWDGTRKGLSSFKGIDAVIHLAGEPVAGKRWTEDRKKAILSSRIDTAQALIDAIKDDLSERPKTFICGSAIGFYGDRGEEVLTEESEVGKGFLAEVVQKWEDVTKPLDQMGIRRVNLRTGAVLGRNGGMLSALVPLFQTGLGGPVGTGHQWVSWIHLQDMVNGIIFLLENEKAHGPFNMVAPHPVSNVRFSRTLAMVVNRPAVLTAPSIALKGALGEMSEIVLASQRVSSEKLENLGFQFQYSDVEDALYDLLDVEQKAGQKELFVEQWVPKKVDEIFPFFSEAKNLGVLTPEFLNFKILSQSTGEMEKGTLVDYQIKIHGIPVHWQTLIQEWEPGSMFVDTQLKGPYKSWHHTHRFIPMKGGTLLSDRVLYRLPLGLLGGLAAGPMVKNDVKKIFDYRQKVINERFGA